MMIESEFPVGHADGVNTKFELAYEPIPGTVELSGVPEDYTFNVSGRIITISPAPPPEAHPIAKYKSAD